MGGDGVVSVAANEIPGELVALCAAAQAGDWDGARRIHERWLPLFRANFRGGPNPVPVKAALALMGLLDDDAVRAPLLPLDPTGAADAGRDAPRARSGRAGGRSDRRAEPAGGGRMSARPHAESARRSTRRPPRRPRGRAGARRRARSDGPGGWRVRPEVKAAILARFRDRTTPRLGGRAADVPRPGAPSGRATCATGRGASCRAGPRVRRGAYLGAGVVVMPPSYVNVGAWVGDGTMVDSHVLVGSCAQIGARVHLAAGVTIGGVLEPPGARPVIVEDDAFVGAGAAPARGRARRAGAVIGAGVTLTGTSRLYDLVRERVLTAPPTPRSPCRPGRSSSPARARSMPFARAHGLAVATALLVKERDPGTNARVALEEALR